MAGHSGDKIQSVALLLPLLGLFLLMPPAVLVFSMPSTIGGLPIIVLYIFTVWGLLIMGAAWLARRLRTPPDIQPPSSAPSPLGQDQAD